MIVTAVFKTMSGRLPRKIVLKQTNSLNPTYGKNERILEL